ncbi:MAG: hypothetical protein HY318_16265 [Armatimonadetes bacterium]|nr:hypothetical protein [Armatimonadota bacterium]
MTTRRTSTFTQRRRVSRRRSRVASLLLFFLLCLCFTVRPVWEWSWRSGPSAWINRRPVKDDRGVKHEVWRWGEGREIWIYPEGEDAKSSLPDVTAGVKAAVHDAEVDLKVVTLSQPPDYTREAFSKALVQRKGETCFDYWRYAKTLARVRTEAHADVLVMNHSFRSPYWAHGMAVFDYGLAVVAGMWGDTHTAKHEAIHVLGYHMHDDFPLWVLGYPDEPWGCFLTGRPREEGLMVLLGKDDHLRQRTRAALREFWNVLQPT